MSVNDEEAAAALAFSNSRAIQYTDCVLGIDGSDGAARLASCVLLDVEGRQVAVSCAHVIRQGAKYFIGPNRLARDQIDGDPGPLYPRQRFWPRTRKLT